ncbi:MAG: hypothetical protein ACE5H8_08855 [Alphaproteobacteria bacterium]
MCGIGGVIYKTAEHREKTGQVAYRILESIFRRGKDSTGVVLWQPNADGLLYVGVNYEKPGWGARIIEYLDEVGGVRSAADHDGYVRAAIAYAGDDRALVDGVDALDDCVTVASIGKHVEVVKNLGGVDNLEKRFRLTDYDGPAAIGLTRNATESRVDFSHAQPLSARTFRDIAIMHNGHITNYLRLRQSYERKGYTFTTGNDSEILAVIVAAHMDRCAGFADALAATIDEVDGAMTYVAVTADAVGLVKDQFGYKPMVVAETDDFVVFASDSAAIRHGVGADLAVWEPGAGEVRVWPL